MKKWIVIVLLLPISVLSEPIADWASSPKLPPKYKEAIEQFKSIKCIPDSRLVGMPIYINTELFAATFGPEKPECIPTNEWDIYGGVVLASYDSPFTVSNWYRGRLTEYSEFSIEQGNIFVKGVLTEFKWNRDYPKYPNILIMPAKGGIKEGGYETTIELNNVSF